MKSSQLNKQPPKPNSNFLLLSSTELEARLCNAIAEFNGVGTTLESAIGSFVLGQHYGTKVLRILHSPATYRKYEKILGIKFVDHCPERTQMSRKVIGIKVADRLGGFWDVVMGRKKVEKKGWIEVGTEDSDHA